jgi:hypothetical protein
MDGTTNEPESVAEAGWDGVKNGERIGFRSLFAKYGSQLQRLLSRKRVPDAGTSVVDEACERERRIRPVSDHIPCGCRGILVDGTIGRNRRARVPRIRIEAPAGQCASESLLPGVSWRRRR